MSKPAISGLPQNILVSSAALLVGGSAGTGGTDVGLISGVKITIKELTTPVHTDQLGKSTVNSFYVGNEIGGECTFDEFTAIKMAVAFPQASLTTSGGAYKLSFGKQVGEDYLSIATQFRIIPTTDDVNYTGRNFTFWKGVFTGDAAIEYGPDKKLVFKAKMMFFPDVTQPSGVWFGYMGDLAAGSLVHAIAAAAVPGSNTGNGTVSNESANDTFTKTETWTLVCIKAAAGGGLFSVTGSVTGARGVATVGSSFNSNSVTPANSELVCKVNAGGTDFVVGDSFTIATTAANFT